jgi:excisionase family DNA binding protein
MTLREAAERTERSVSTLRRYIRSGRLRAAKLAGRFGPEFFVSDEDLAEAGLQRASGEASVPAVVRAAAPRQLDKPARDGVPLSLFQELQMKHEQLLVQYGMVRASGLRTMTLQSEAEDQRRQIDSFRLEVAALQERLARETAVLRTQIHELELLLEGKQQENSALREKMLALEMLNRNAVTTETIDRQFGQVMEQTRLVDSLSARTPARRGTPPLPFAGRPSEPEH